MTKKIKTDVVVAGGGSGGFGAALAAARAGLQVVLLEKKGALGGASTLAGVNCWEPSCGGTGIPFDVYLRLKGYPEAVGFYTTHRHVCWPEDGCYPGGESLIDPTLVYRDSLLRYAEGNYAFGNARHKPIMRARMHGMVFEPEIMSRVMRLMLTETGKATVLMNTSVVDAEVSAGDGSRVVAVYTDNELRIEADYYVDATGDAILCSLSGCDILCGQDPHSLFGEPGAPEEPSDHINGVSQIFRVSRKKNTGIDRVPESIPEKCWWRERFVSAAVNEYPNGDLNFNMLPTMEGKEYLAFGKQVAKVECQRRVMAFWRHVQTTYPEFRHFGVVWVAPELGIREGRRTLCEYMLRQQDLAGGLGEQGHGDIVAINDHPMDTHGLHSRGLGALNGAYGIPYRCLIPKGKRNLLVACRAAGFSSIAASSCRLSRTMMQLGQAAGTALEIAVYHGVTNLAEVPADLLRAKLVEAGVALEHPMPPAIARRIGRR